MCLKVSTKVMADHVLNSIVRHKDIVRMERSFPDKSFKPFRVSRIPAWPLTGEQLEKDRMNAEQNFADILGCSLFQQRDDVLTTFAELVNDEEYRKKLGSANAASFAGLAALTPEQRSVALSVAELAMNRMIESFAGTLACGERTLPGNYCVEYKVNVHLLKVVGANADGVKLKKMTTCTLADDDHDILSRSFGRWLGMFG